MPAAFLSCVVVLLLAASASAQDVLLEVVGDAGAQFGVSVDVMGDVDGDGVGEVVVGAHLGDGVTPKSGTVTIVSGATGATLAELSGVLTDSWFGKTVAGLGDVDGDGVGDMAVSAVREAGPAGNFSGVVRVISGATGGVLHSWSGSSAGAWWGKQVHRYGDLDGDGIDDVLVSSEDEPSSNTGTVTVYSGATGGVLRSWTATNGDTLGSVCAPAGDLDDDGAPDVLVYVSRVGGVFGTRELRAFSGATGALLHAWPDVKVTEAGLANNGSGPPCAGLGDVDGDGHDDVITNDLDGPGPLSNDVVARVFSGATGAELLVVPAGDTNSSFAHSVAGPGDVDGDGLADLAIATPFAPPTGRVELRSGVDGALLATLNGSLDATRFGEAMRAGDVDGDGTPELLVGQPSASTAAPIAGRVFVFGPPCPGGFAGVGAGVVGTGGVAPSLAGVGCPTEGEAPGLALTDALGGATAFWIAALAGVDLPFKGGALYVDPVGAIVASLPLPPSGALDVPLPVLDASFVGLDLHVQVFVDDAAAVAGFAATPGLVVEIR